MKPELGKAPANASGNVDGLRARVITDPNDLEKLTYERFTDTRTAMSRGLCEYLSGLSIHWAHGRLLKFEKVFPEWGEPEVPAVLPALAVVGEGPGTYDDAEMSAAPYWLDESLPLAKRRAVKDVAELSQTFNLMLWATDKHERMGLVALLEDAMEPADFMTGLRLELPFYFNTRATFEKLTIDYLDGVDDAQRRIRRADVAVSGTITQIVPVGEKGILHPRLQVEVDGVSDE